MVPDLLIAPAAELARSVVRHVDKDFDLIASISGQPVEHLRTLALPEPGPGSRGSSTMRRRRAVDTIKP